MMVSVPEKGCLSTALVWVRRDLRCFDHAALHHALQAAQRVHVVFVFDTTILEPLTDRADRRVAFIHASVRELDGALDAWSRAAGGSGSGVLVCHGDPQVCIPQLARVLRAEAVFANRDYEPAAIARDQAVARQLGADGIDWFDFKDQVVFDRDELLTQAGRPFSVFTPYKQAWLKRVSAADLAAYPVEPFAVALAPVVPGYALPDLSALGFEEPAADRIKLAPGMSGADALWADFQARIEHYREARDFPARKGVSYLSVHLRFGTVSIRSLARLAWQQGGAGAETWLSELIWRDFYHMILWHHPHVVDQPFRAACRAVVWDERPDWLAAWCEARTGYPLVDAAMRQLHQTGYMHNRLRMVVASFLTKDLGIDWRLGERHFAAHLLDYDLAANNGGWQWAASTGCDAQPWFRIFNPVTQSEKFDPQGRFIRRYVPELTNVPDRYVHAPWTMSRAVQQAHGVQIGVDYPAPVVDHALARQRALQRFGVLSRQD